MYFYLDTPNKKTSAIKVRYYVKSEKKTFIYSTGISINPKNWNKQNRMPKPKVGAAGFELKQITNQLNRIVEHLHISISNIELEKKQVTRSELKKRLDAKFRYVVVKGTLINKLDDFILEKEKLGKTTKKSNDKYRGLKTKIHEYNDRLKLNDINKDFMIDFISYLRHEKNLTDISLNRNIGYLKTFLKWCKYAGLTIDESYNQVTVKTHDADHVSLTKDKIEILENLKLSSVLDKYRDLFLIGIYSGQRFSDYSVFKKSDVVNNRIVKRAEKTQYKSYIPISKKLDDLLNKWDWRLPKVSNQKFNDNIKDICKQAGFNEEVTTTKYKGSERIIQVKPFYSLVSSHTARRTFITIAANSNVPDHIIMAITGIRDPKTLKTYKKFQENELEKYIDTIF